MQLAAACAAESDANAQLAAAKQQSAAVKHAADMAAAGSRAESQVLAEEVCNLKEALAAAQAQLKVRAWHQLRVQDAGYLSHAACKPHEVLAVHLRIISLTHD